MGLEVHTGFGAGRVPTLSSRWAPRAKSSTGMVDTMPPGVSMNSIHWGLMTTHGLPETTARRALWVGGMLVILAGLFGMHGLDSHGTAGMASMTEASMPESVTGVAGAADAMVTPVQDVSPAVSTEAVVTAHPLMGMGMAGMCLAILAVALIALLRLLLTTKTRPVVWLVARPARAPASSARDSDPPFLIKLSIQRC